MTVLAVRAPLAVDERRRSRRVYLDHKPAVAVVAVRIPVQDDAAYVPRSSGSCLVGNFLSNFTAVPS